MAKEFLEDIIPQVSVADMQRVHLPSARALFTEISEKTEHPYQPGQFGSKNPKMLSTSVKFEKAPPDQPVLRRVEQRGVYLMPAGQHGCADACKYKSAGCPGGCINITGRLAHGTALPTQMARTHMLEKHPAEALAIIADEAHTHFSTVIRKGGLPSLRLDGTSELHIDNTEAGDFIYGGPGGMYQRKRGRSEGELAGFPMAIGSEYGKKYAQDVLPGPTPQSRQSNVKRVASWSENTTEARGKQLQSEGLDLAVPTTGYGVAQHPKELPSLVRVQFHRGGGELIMPTADYDLSDAVGARKQTGSAGILRVKRPAFGFDPLLSPARQRASERFLGHHPPVGEPVKAPRKRR